MSEKDTKIAGGDLDNFVLDETVSSASVIKPDEAPVGEAPVKLVGEEEGLEGRSPAFKELAIPKLPELEKENRARLLMQSPNRLFFYWSIRTNPFRTLGRAFGARTGSYTLVLKLIDTKRDTEEIFPVEAEGSWWFDVESDRTYRAEIGFYAPNGPYVRLMFSNEIETPRKAPSPRIADSSEWTVSANAFASILDVSGFAQDAFDVAMAGDDVDAARHATHSAFTEFISDDGSEVDLSGFNSEDLRLALLALASGVELEALRGYVGENIYQLLKEHIAVLSAEKAASALEKHFHISGEEDLEEEHIGAAVYGASLVNFPRLSIRKRGVPRLSPLSSFSIGTR